MDNRSFTLGLAGLGGVAALLASTRAAQPPPVPPHSDTIPAATQGRRPYQTGSDLLASYLGRNRGIDPTDRLRGYQLTVLIALLPDPVESHLDWAFDAELESLRRAYERDGYVMDRFWLPGRRESPPPLGKQSDTTLLVLPLREDRPGVMLFRHADSRSNLALVYIVGEVPTAGVHKPALLHALSERRNLLTVFETPAQSTDTIRILGPAFSGSVASLRLALDTWFADPQHATNWVLLESGSATSGSNPEAFAQSPIQFRATVNSDDVLGAALDSILDVLSIPDSRVALLRESTTLYGHRLIEQDMRGYLDVPFPMNISSLRTEYARNPVAQAAPENLPGEPTGPRIPLNLEDSARFRENLPVTSALTTPAVDILLDEIAQTLRDHQIRAVGLLATDVRDKLFLGSEIRKRVHDVQLFTYESNVLYLRPDLNEWLRGMLVFTSYPLFHQDRPSENPSGVSRLLTFPSEGAEGVYNAALLLLGMDSAVTDYALPGDSLTTDSSRGPPVWVTAVGRSSFLPVTVLSGSSLEHQLQPEPYLDTNLPLPPRPGVALRPVGFLGSAAYVLLGITICLLALWSLMNPSLEEDPLHPLAPDDRGVRIASLRIHRELYCMLLFLALGSMFAPAAILMTHEADGGPFLGFLIVLFPILVGVAWLTAVLSGSAAAFRLAARYRRLGWRYATGKWPSRKKQLLWWLEVFARTVVLLGGLGYAYLTTRYVFGLLGIGPPVLYRLFLNRATQIDGGVSPLVPLTLVGTGFAVWCVWHIKRVALLAEPRTPFEEASELQTAESTLGASSEWIRSVRERLFLVVPNPWALFLALLLLIACVWLQSRLGRSLESLILPPLLFWGSAFDVLFKLAIVATLAATPWAVIRLLFVWQGLDRCLQELGATPLVEAFDRLPPRISRLARLTLFAMGPARAVQDVAETQWTHLGRIFKEKEVEFETLLLRRQDLLAKIRALAASPRPRISRQESPGSATANGLTALQPILEDLWRLEPTAKEIDRAVTEDLQSEPFDTTRMLRRSFADPVRLWLRLAEELVAVQVVDYCEWVLRHLRILTLFLLIALLLTMTLLSSYPFEGQVLVKLVFFGIMLGTIGAIVFVVARLNRDEVLSRITKTEPGRITWNGSFVLHLLVVGGVPLLTLISTEFPQVRTFLFSWLEPVFKALARN